MTIKKGQEWGEPSERPDGLRVAHSDAELALMLKADRLTPVTVRGGDVFKAVGSPPERTSMYRLPMDLMDVYLDDEATLAVAHVTAYRSLWLGALFGAFNVSDLGEWNVTPRSHPNDGLLDEIEVTTDFSLRDRWNARSRLRSGTHVPHPNIKLRRNTSIAWHFGKPVPIRIDGGDPIRSQTVRIEIEPDAFELFV